MDENELTEVDEQEEYALDMSNFMTPDEMAEFKVLQAKMKNQAKAMGGVKKNFFNSLSENFGASMVKAKKDLISISTKTELEDGNVYTVTLGAIETDEEAIDTQKLASEIVTENLTLITQLLGVSYSTKIPGEIDGKKVFWQIRKQK